MRHNNLDWVKKPKPPVNGGRSPLEPALTIAQTMIVLQLSRSTVNRLIKSGELPANRIGVKSIRIEPDGVRKLLQKAS